MNNRLADGTGDVVGRTHAACITTRGARDFRKSEMTCTGSIVLGDGTLLMQAHFPLKSGVVRGAITGGTGAYAGARGTFTSEQRDDGAFDTVNLED
jgi:hypothetical protein